MYIHSSSANFFPKFKSSIAEVVHCFNDSGTTSRKRRQSEHNGTISFAHYQLNAVAVRIEQTCMIKLVPVLCYKLDIYTISLAPFLVLHYQLKTVAVRTERICMIPTAQFVHYKLKTAAVRIEQICMIPTAQFVHYKLKTTASRISYN